MARWDEIMSLPVQSPPALEFSSSDLVWSKVEGWWDKKDRVALIPFPRVDDFLRGECSNKECPTRFHVEARQRHNKSVEKQGGLSNRDDLLAHRYRQERVIRRSVYELDADDAVSISMWIENHQSHVFFYEDYSDIDPFTFGIQTEWQLQQTIRFGNRRSLIASDSRFGTTKLKSTRLTKANQGTSSTSYGKKRVEGCSVASGGIMSTTIQVVSLRERYLDLFHIWYWNYKLPNIHVSN